jgi:hypothetical protein
MFENRVLRRIFRLKRDEMMGWWRKFHNELLHDVFSSPSIIRMIKLGRWILLRWTTETKNGVVSAEFVGSGYGQVESSCECGNECSGSIKC